MMKLILTLSIALVLTSCSYSDSSQLSSNFNKSESFHVYGNCSSCKKTIERSLSDLDGIGNADWDKETKQIKVDFDSTKISLSQIKNKIAAVGYDTKEARAEESVYLSLPGCCQYDRPE